MTRTFPGLTLLQNASLQFIAFLVALGLGLCFSQCGCTARGPEPSKASADQLHSVVTLVRPIVADRWSSLADDEPSYSQGIAMVGYCNAFAIARDGALALVTAAHCVAVVGADLGSTLRYLPPDGWGIASARVVYLDSSGDRAVLLAPGEHGLVPLARGVAPAPGATVFSVSSYFGETCAGTVAGPLVGGWFDTTQRVQYGWSGSPAITNGRAWGLVAKCHTGITGKCGTGTIVAELGAL